MILGNFPTLQIIILVSLPAVARNLPSIENLATQIGPTCPVYDSMSRRCCSSGWGLLLILVWTRSDLLVFLAKNGKQQVEASDGMTWGGLVARLSLLILREGLREEGSPRSLETRREWRAAWTSSLSIDLPRPRRDRCKGLSLLVRPTGLIECEILSSASNTSTRLYEQTTAYESCYSQRVPCLPRLGGACWCRDTRVAGCPLRSQCTRRSRHRTLLPIEHRETPPRMTTTCSLKTGHIHRARWRTYLAENKTR